MKKLIWGIAFTKREKKRGRNLSSSCDPFQLYPRLDFYFMAHIDKFMFVRDWNPRNLY